MDSEEYDSDLERSLAELDEEQASISSEEPQSEEQSNAEEDSEGEPDNQEQEKPKGKKNQEEEQKRDYYREHLQPDEQIDTSQPPFIVVVHGSKQSGKSSVIRSLVKHYTHHKIDKVNGTVTLRSNKKQRITLVECPNDMSAMIDLAKIADIVLLLIDASLGLEMQTFEFLSLLKCHGFPSIMGVATHLDFYKDNKQMRKSKKKLKQRFEYEVGGNNKLFFMSKWEYGLYPRIEAAKLARYIGNSKAPAFPFRVNHPYLLADRWQVNEDGQFKKDDEVDVAFYGYVRGCSYRVNGRVYVLGVGDFLIKSIETLRDPCPEFQMIKNEHHKGLKKDAKEEESDQEPENEGKQILTKKKKTKRVLNQNERIIYAPHCNLGVLNIDHSSGYVTIPHQYIKFTTFGEEDQEENIEEGVKMVRGLQNMKESLNQQMKKRNAEIELFEGVEMESDEDSVQNNFNKVKRELTDKTQELQRMKKHTADVKLVDPEQNPVHRYENLSSLIYESTEKHKTFDCSKYHPQGHFSDNLKDLFVTGMEEDVLNEVNNQSEEESDSEMQNKKEIAKLLNQNHKKALIGGQTNFFQYGSYVKIVLQKMNYGTFLQFESSWPMVLTKTNLGQDNFGFIKIKFKRHRWYNNLLKSNDPIIVSCGWRRYQSLIVFAMEDQNQRLRYLKYTPRHEFCTAVFYGNFVQQDTTCIFSQTVRNDLKKFRIAGSGLVSQINKSHEIMKKIKLVGEPYKIMKNTCYIRGMFNSHLEVANYIGAQIRTVSGIRGQVKKAIKEGGQGTFRATFEDKVSMSDLIFCRTWYQILLERYYNPVLTFPKNHRLMKTKYELRIEKGIENQMKPDSDYKEVDRVPKTFMPLMIPKKLQAKLPFKTVEKVKSNKKDRIRQAEEEGIPKMLKTDKEKDVAYLIQRLNTIRKEKQDRKSKKKVENRRIKEARERPRKEYYESLKKTQKAQKMAKLSKKNSRQKQREEPGSD